VAPGGSPGQRATVIQQKTGRPGSVRDHRFDAGCIGRVAGDPWPPRRRLVVPQPQPTGRSHQRTPIRTPGWAMGRDARLRAAGLWDSQPAPHQGRPRPQEDGKSARLSAFAGTPASWRARFVISASRWTTR